MNNETDNITIWQISIDHCESRDDGKSFTRIQSHSYLFSKEINMRDFLEQLLQDERRNLKAKNLPNARFDEARFGKYRMSWNGVLRNDAGMRIEHAIAVFRKETDAKYIEKVICGDVRELL